MHFVVFLAHPISNARSKSRENIFDQTLQTNCWLFVLGSKTAELKTWKFLDELYFYSFKNENMLLQSSSAWSY